MLGQSNKVTNKNILLSSLGELLIPIFELAWPGFKSRVDPLLLCFFTCLQWIPQFTSGETPSDLFLARKFNLYDFS